MSETDFQSNIVPPYNTYDVISTRPIRHDGADKVAIAKLL